MNTAEISLRKIVNLKTINLFVLVKLDHRLVSQIGVDVK